MMRRLFPLLMLFLVLPAMGEDIVTPTAPFTGWSWYNEPKKAPNLLPHRRHSPHNPPCRI